MEMVGSSPTKGVQRISDQLSATRMCVWRTLCHFALCPFHAPSVHALQPTEYTARVELSLALGKPAAPHENFIHRKAYVQQTRTD
jgi:hypothetical protein